MTAEKRARDPDPTVCTSLSRFWHGAWDYPGAAGVALKAGACVQVGFKRTGRKCECGGGLRDQVLDW